MAENHAVDVEVQDNELELLPVMDKSIDGYKNSIEDMEWLANNIGKVAELQKKIYLGVLKMTIAGDFIIFGSGDKQKAELGTAGAERIARVGVSIIDSKMVKETGSDEVGSYYQYVATATATFRDRKIAITSIASSRDKFFGKEGGEFKPLSEVSERDVRTAAFRGLIKEGVKSLLGLRRLDPKELESYGIKCAGGGGHDFKSKDQKAADTQIKSIGIKAITHKVIAGKTDKAGNPLTIYSIEDVDGVIYQTFSMSAATTAKNCKDGKLVAELSYTVDPKYGAKLSSIEQGSPLEF